MATSDLHVHLMPYDYYADRPAPGLGMAEIGRIVRAVRATHPEALLVDNGDFLQGTPLSDLQAESDPAGAGLHPVIAAMNALGYDTIGLGNHEFNYGLDHLTGALKDAAFPVLCANIVRRLGPTPAEDAPLVAPFTVLRRWLALSDGSCAEVRIGVIAVAPPQILDWDRARIGDRLAARDVLEAARAHLPALRDAGADIVLALSHGGIGAARHTPMMENATVPLAALGGIDAIVGGHTHVLFPGPQVAATPEVDPVAGRIHGVPAVLPGFHGTHLGVIDLLLDLEDDRWRTADSRAALWPVSGTGDPGAPPDPAVVAAARPAHERTLAHIRKPIATAAGPIFSHFDQVAPSATLAMVARAQRCWLGDRLRDTPFAALPVLSAVAPFRSGGRGGPGNYSDLRPGPILLRHAAEIYQYANSPAAVLMRGHEVRLWLEQAAGAFRQVPPGSRDAPLLDPAMPSYNFDVLHGLTYAIDLSGPARFDPEGREVRPEARRIRDLRHDGRPVRDSDLFVVLTNSYRAGGGGGFEMVRRAEPLLSDLIPTREALIEMIRAEERIVPEAPQVWRFAPIEGASAVFHSGPGALAHLPAVRDRRIAPVGLGADGFWAFRLALDPALVLDGAPAYIDG